MTHSTSGTKEWADANLNIYQGCKEDCSYCYAKRMAKHYGRIKSLDDWKYMELNETALNGSIPKRKNGSWIKWFMFPSTHNITPDTVKVCLKYILRVLRETSANLLIVIKPCMEVVMKLCDHLIDYKHRILFRFTITSLSTKLLRIYEPNAPRFTERFTSLRYAHYMGFRTSVSIEPFLDKNPIPLIQLIAEFINDTIWLGIMSGSKYPYHTKENVESIVLDILMLPDNIKRKMRLKDSIKNKWGFRLG